MRKLLATVVLSLIAATGCGGYWYTVKPNAVDPRNDNRIVSECVTVYEVENDWSTERKAIGQYCKAGK